MPTYEYTCSSCDTRHEIVQKMTDPTLTDCPDCGQPTLRKLFNGVGVVFKGSGFYRTDSRSGNADKSNSASDSSKGKDSASTSSNGSSSSSSSSSSSNSSSTSSNSSSASSSGSTSSSKAAS